ncbi:FprA family A-type flavoprotein [Dethiothermospora halolimnae]|uniref:FprA family A-type flavoprotein n=1 Tax=Dethiothermospora halolimnae TaxID=3114390 RepID=UPI003CCC413A
MIKRKEIAEKSYWIGKVDDRKVPFHRLTLEKGTTYNSYLLDTEEPTIIDTVDILYGREYVENLQEHTDLNSIKYIVINHVEPDHAGALPALINKTKNATIVTTEKGKELLKDMFRLKDKKYLVVRDGDKLDIGGKILHFYETPYLHTEETMITYCEEDKILYPCDIFSTHIANEELFNDLATNDITEDFKVYYKLIMHPHRPYVRDMLKKLKNLDIDMIAPSHGYILRNNPEKYIKLYDEMSDVGNINKNGLILFTSMTGNTAKIAQNISKGLENLNINTDIINAKNTDMEVIKEKAEKADVIFIGTSTRYADMIGNIEYILNELIKLDLSDKFGVAFGSYGWSGEGVEIINDYIRKSNMTLLDKSYLIKTTGVDDVDLPLRVKFTPNEDSKAICVKVGKTVGEVLLSN